MNPDLETQPGKSSTHAKDIAFWLKYPRVPSKVVYLLGSGFSYPLGIPIIRDFLPKGVALLKEEPPTEYASDYPSTIERWRLIQQIMNVADAYRRTLANICEVEPTIEDMFSLADLFGEKDPEKTGSQSPREVLAEFIQLVCDVGWRSHELRIKKGCHTCTVPRSHFAHNANLRMPADGIPGSGVCLYKTFLSQVLASAPSGVADGELLKAHNAGYGGPAIICLNYDLILENKLTELIRRDPASISAPFFYGADVQIEQPIFIPNVHLLPLIKLHGSINWQEDKTNYITINPTRRASGKVAPLVFPSWQRSSVCSTVFPKLMEEARIHLRLATKLVIIGYSMPLSDMHLRYLLADAFDTLEMPEIIVANRFKTIDEARTQVRKMLGARAASQVTKNYSGGLDDYVRDHNDPSSFATVNTTS